MGKTFADNLRTSRHDPYHSDLIEDEKDRQQQKKEKKKWDQKTKKKKV